MTTIGIDPGRSGGLVALMTFWDGSHRLVASLRMPDEPLEIRDFLKSHSTGNVFIERIPKWCGVAQFLERPIPASSLAVLYGNFQLCLGVCVGLGIRPTLLAPLKWQNTVGCRNVTHLKRDEWKRKLQAHARLLVKSEVPLWMADALLIAHAGALLTPQS